MKITELSLTETQQKLINDTTKDMFRKTEWYKQREMTINGSYKDLTNSIVGAMKGWENKSYKVNNHNTSGSIELLISDTNLWWSPKIMAWNEGDVNFTTISTILKTLSQREMSCPEKIKEVDMVDILNLQHMLFGLTHDHNVSCNKDRHTIEQIDDQIETFSRRSYDCENKIMTMFQDLIMESAAVGRFVFINENGATKPNYAGLGWDSKIDEFEIVSSSSSGKTHHVNLYQKDEVVKTLTRWRTEDLTCFLNEHIKGYLQSILK
tara:strand:- start:3099 stop:3893 length:795 start_codon:yes stop_codon:yes gene_type:complete